MGRTQWVWLATAAIVVAGVCGCGASSGPWTATGEATVLRGWFGGSPQGVAAVDGGASLVFSGKQFLRHTKLPVPGTGHGMKYATVAENRDPISPDLAKDGYEHIGDVGAAFGTLYAPIERQATYTHPVIAFFDPVSLAYTGSHFVTDQHHCPWVAVDAATALLFSSEYSNVTSLYAYSVAGPNGRQLGDARLVPLLNIPPAAWPLGLQEVQGGVVFAPGLLVLSSSAPTQPLYVFDISAVASGGPAVWLSGTPTNVGGEPEGLTFVDGHLIAVLHTSDPILNDILQYRYINTTVA